MNYCAACGAARQSGADFCGACGRHVGDTHQPPAQPPVEYVDPILTAELPEAVRRELGPHEAVLGVFGVATAKLNQDFVGGLKRVLVVTTDRVIYCNYGKLTTAQVVSLPMSSITAVNVKGNFLGKVLEITSINTNMTFGKPGKSLMDAQRLINALRAGRVLRVPPAQ